MEELLLDDLFGRRAARGTNQERNVDLGLSRTSLWRQVSDTRGASRFPAFPIAREIARAGLQTGQPLR